MVKEKIKNAKEESIINITNVRLFLIAKTTQQQTHTVQSTDNLYRIAIKYYGDGSAANIEKIKKANNLTSDSISTGQVLIINP